MTSLDDSPTRRSASLSTIILLLVLARAPGQAEVHASHTRALDVIDVLGLLLDEYPGREIAKQVATRGVAFALDQEYLRLLRQAGADNTLIKRIDSQGKETR